MIMCRMPKKVNRELNKEVANNGVGIKRVIAVDGLSRTQYAK